jgi:hypothetical protein
MTKIGGVGQFCLVVWMLSNNSLSPRMIEVVQLALEKLPIITFQNLFCRTSRLFQVACHLRAALPYRFSTNTMFERHAQDPLGHLRWFLQTRRTPLPDFLRCTSALSSEPVCSSLLSYLKDITSHQCLNWRRNHHACSAAAVSSFFNLIAIVSPPHPCLQNSQWLAPPPGGTGPSNSPGKPGLHARHLSIRSCPAPVPCRPRCPPRFRCRS